MTNDKMTRRTLILGSIATATIGGLALRSRDEAQPHTPYFSTLNQRLQASGDAAIPRLLIDKTRLTSNCATIKSMVEKNNKQLRLVVKSLPSLPLLKYISDALETQRFMVFHQPYINDMVVAMPTADFLLGKPMPVQAVARFYDTWQSSTGAKKTTKRTASSFDPSQQLQWLVDTKERLEEYLALAKTIGQTLLINVEIDVGLHRGGLTSPEQLRELLSIIEENAEHLRFSGLMGYDAHVGKLPSIVESAKTTLIKSQAVYQSYIDVINSAFPTLCAEPCYNGAGSPTFAMHGHSSPLTEVSVGSACVKASDFDLPSLSALEPATFISTPVLKSIKGLHLPGPELTGQAMEMLDKTKRHSFFIYGGYWKANPVSPSGLQTNSMYGYSSNQELYNASSDLGLKVNDLVFFRPTQSEAVLKQFGALLVIDGDETEEWPVFV